MLVGFHQLDVFVKNALGIGGRNYKAFATAQEAKLEKIMFQKGPDGMGNGFGQRGGLYAFIFFDKQVGITLHFDQKITRSRIGIVKHMPL